MSLIHGMTAQEFDVYCAKKLLGKLDNARQRGIEFNLSFTAIKNLMKAKRCYYTGVKLTLPTGGADTLKANSLTIDRIDSSLGYVPGNVVACSHAFNQLKANVDSAGKQGMKMMSKAFKKAEERFKC